MKLIDNIIRDQGPIKNEKSASDIMGSYLIINALVLIAGIIDTMVNKYTSPLLGLGFIQLPITLGAETNAIIKQRVLHRYLKYRLK